MSTSSLTAMDHTLDTRLAPDVTLAAGGDRDAFGRLVAATTSTVCAISFAILRDRTTSEDVAQEVYLSAWRALPRLENPRSFLPWLRQITRNQARGHLRRRGARHEEGTGDAVLERAADGRPDPQADLEDREAVRIAAAALAELPDEAREVLVLYYREGRSSRQVARLLGLSDAAVRQRLSRARTQVRRDVAGRLRRGIEGTAPTAALVATLVAHATTAAAPAGAAVLGGAAARGAAGGAFKAVGLTGVLSALPGILGGVGGVVLGLRPYFREAMDERERDELRHFRTLAVAGTACAGFGLVLSAVVGHWLAPTITYCAFLAFLWVLYFHRLPRIVSRRMAIELRDDPDAPRRLARRRLVARLGFVAGALCGGAGLVYGLWSSGLLPG